MLLKGCREERQEDISAAAELGLIENKLFWDTCNSGGSTKLLGQEHAVSLSMYSAAPHTVPCSYTNSMAVSWLPS